MQRALTVLGLFMITIMASAIFIGPEAFILLGVLLFVLTITLSLVLGRK